MRTPVIAGNWKMYKTPAQAAGFAYGLKQWNQDVTGVHCIICAPFTSLPELTEALEGTSYSIGAQNMHWEAEGAYTGEVSGPMLKELGVEYVIIGHSERRTYFHETDEIVNRKVHAALSHGLKPIICVGEHLDERESGRTMEVCRRQIAAATNGLNDWQLPHLLIAYEPVWAIGTGKTASAQDAQDVIGGIRQQMADQFGQTAADRLRILYGGSVKPDNIGELMAMPDIDGALVGGASLEVESYIQLVQEVMPS